MDSIIIYLSHGDLTHLRWAIVSASGSLQKIIPNGTFEMLTADAMHKSVIVVAPPESVLLSSAKLPKLNRQRLRQVLPFTLEEQLLTDVNELHFAVGPYQADGTLPVAIVNKATLSAWLNLFQAAEITPTYLLPAPLTLPYTENDWYIHMQDNGVCVRTGLYSGFGCDKANLATCLALHTTESAHPPQTIYLLNSPPLDIDNPAIKDKLKTYTLADTQPIIDVLQQAKTAINLLQGEFQTKQKTARYKKIWTLAGSILAAWLVAILLSNTISYFILRHAAGNIETAIHAIYKENFPQAKSVVAPKERLADKLNSLMHQNQKNRLLIWLAYLGNSLKETPTLKIKQLDYRNNQLNVDISAPNFATVDQFTQALSKQHITVKQQNIATSNREVKGALIITEGTAT